ncbi:Hypothetical protein DIP1230 [Corynebacterium diphtheriae]|uniref:Uncharacterized protein n=1 Tax=Corynebacterium diphtheriae (strain ATCC 700971 / NCTC 13129 / Biotype gravis) TaxID=257309 RepID=Q6NHB0_CORDI|nr:Hypothetical protein DIP1230 [Corynebacterium diphtheriae]
MAYVLFQNTSFKGKASRLWSDCNNGATVRVFTEFTTVIFILESVL